MRLIKSHASGRKLIACRGQEEVSFSPHAAVHNWLSAVSWWVPLAGTPAHRLLLEWVTKPSTMAVSQRCLAAISSSSVCPCCSGADPMSWCTSPPRSLSILCILTLHPRFLPLPPPHSSRAICTSPPPASPTPCLCTLPQAPPCWLGAQADKPG